MTKAVKKKEPEVVMEGDKVFVDGVEVEIAVILPINESSKKDLLALHEELKRLGISRIADLENRIAKAE